MAKRTISNLALYLKAVELKEFQRMFPHVAEMNGVATYLERNKLAITRIDEVQLKIMKDAINFDDKNQPKQVQVGGKVIEINGQPSQQPEYDFDFKSDELRDAFLKANKEFQEEEIQVIE